ncbi:MAG: ParA family protein [Halanaerobacter sp.]
MEINTKIISFTNQKGGVGKTSIAYHLAGVLITEFDRRVLVIDLDSQANLTDSFKIDNFECSSYDLVTNGDVNLQDMIIKTHIKGLDLVPANVKLANIDLDIADKKKRLELLDRKIDKQQLNYDYIFIDCPPNLSLLTNNSLVASDSLLIPLKIGLYSLRGLSKLTDTYKIIKKRYNKDLEIEGVVLNQVDRRTNYEDFEEKLRAKLGDNIFNTIIGQSIKVSRAQFERLPVTLFKPRSKTAKEFISLAQEVMEL